MKQTLEKNRPSNRILIAGIIAIVVLISGCSESKGSGPATRQTPCPAGADPIRDFRMQSDAMAPSFVRGDRVWICKKDQPSHRGDVLAFTRRDDPGEAPDGPFVFISRVIGLPGEEITAQDGFVYVNGARLTEDYLRTGDIGTTLGIDNPMSVTAGNVLFMGDNRSNSFDSRYFGTIPEEQVIGLVVSDR